MLNLQDDLGIMKQQQISGKLNLHDDIGIFQPQKDSVATMGISYLKEHPFKSLLQGIPETLTGKSIEDRAHEATKPFEGVRKDEQGTVIVPKESDYQGSFIREALAGMAGSAVDVATAPASYLPIPGAKLLGEIPVGSTTVGRIAKNVAVGTGFKGGVQELQRMESALQVSGKLSSRGLPTGNYLPEVDKKIVDTFNKFINPTIGKFKNKTQLDAYQSKVIDSTKTIVDYSPTIKFENPETGVVERRLPQSRSDYLDALTQTKEEIYKQYSSLANQAGQQDVKIDLKSAIDKVVDPLLKNEAIQRNAPELMPKIQKLKDAVASGKLLSPEEAQKEIEFLNAQLQAYYKNPTMQEQSISVVKASLVHNIRVATDDAIEAALGRGGYQELRNKYSSLKAIEADLTKAAAKQLKAMNNGVVNPVVDSLSGGEVAIAVLKGMTGHPGAATHLVRPIGWKGMKFWREWINNPDRNIKDMFEKVAKSSTTFAKANPNYVAPAVEAIQKPLRSAAEITAPRQLGYEKPLPEYLSNRENIPPMRTATGEAKIIPPEVINQQGKFAPQWKQQKMFGESNQAIDLRGNVSNAEFKDVPVKNSNIVDFKGNTQKERIAWQKQLEIEKKKLSSLGNSKNAEQQRNIVSAIEEKISSLSSNKTSLKNQRGTASYGKEEVYQGEKDITTKVLNKLVGRAVTSKQFISDLTNQPELKQAERDLIRQTLAEFGDTVNVKEFADKIKVQLLPLNVNKQLIMGRSWEHISLPDELRGAVANYDEHVYESPIKTSAGAAHFEQRTYPNYFAHARVEDLPTTKDVKINIGQTVGVNFSGGDSRFTSKIFTVSKMLPNNKVEVVYDPPINKLTGQKPEISVYDIKDLEIHKESKRYSGATRRILEIQSDLFQKGNLERSLKSVGQGAMGRRTVNVNKLNKDMTINDAKSKLSPYENTWHERIIREEIKQASKDGKTKLRFPTGEAAMKIEGLGNMQGWRDLGMPGEPIRGQHYPELKTETLKVGKEISSILGGVGSSERWIITDVLGDGKFKAIPKNILDANMDATGSNLKEALEQVEEVAMETFDISGKVDTNNPIYRFYEKEVARYLKRIAPDVQRITDKQGVTWNEINVPKQSAKLPVEAFAGAGIGTAAVSKAINDNGKDKTITGQASTYGWGEKLNKNTFSGAKFDAEGITAAMRNVPMGSKAEVTDLKTGKKITVEINDGGPAIKTGRIIDLSKGAWKELGYNRAGLTNVKVKIIALGNGRSYSPKKR